MFHLGWFTSFKPHEWPLEGPAKYAWNKPDLYVDVARDLERARFDLIVLEDSELVPDTYGGSRDIYLKHAIYAPKNIPLALVPVLTTATEHIGVVATATTSYYPPFMIARLFAAYDQMSDGRVGWNIVTSSSDGAAQNYGRKEHYDHDERYEMADEYVELVSRLWDSWDPDAVLLDGAVGVFADPLKVHEVNFEGKYFRSRGPLNTVRSPQGHPVYCQAGGSPRGRRFAARNAEVVIAAVNTVEEMKEYRDDVRRQMKDFGRSPDSNKILFCVTPIVATSMKEARALAEQRMQGAREHIDVALAGMGASSGIDFSTFDLDAPLPAVSTNGSRSTLGLISGESGMTLREIMEKRAETGNVELVGTPDYVAGRMAEVMDEVGGDGFFISGSLRPAYVATIVDGLAPALRARKLIRSEYRRGTFRDNLLEF